MNTTDLEHVKNLLEEKTELYNNPLFIESDPISIPHMYNRKQDIEISGFFAAIFAWGQRTTIINKTNELMSRFDNTPYDFIVNHTDSDLKQLIGFKHRTFNDSDLLYFVDFFKHHYQKHSSLEDAFIDSSCADSPISIEDSLIYFHNYFFTNPNILSRTRKHISTPAKHSACKRLNMYLRWMVRKDDKKVDFGLWKKLKPNILICPLDVHVERTARILQLVTRNKPDWAMATELTEKLRILDPADPVKYDFALFGLSIENSGKSAF